MMKKILFAALAAFTLAGAAQAASLVAGVTNRVDVLKFRTHKAAGYQGEPGAVSDFGTFDAIDSLFASSIGVAGADWPIDTTTAISTDGWFFPENPALADSTDLFTVFVYDKDGSSVATGVDSMYIAVQGSVDGRTWVTNRTFVGGTISNIASRLDQTNVTGAFRGMLSVNGASLVNGAPVWMQRYRRKDTAVAQEPSDSNLACWPYLRFIVGSHDTGGHKISVAVSHLAVDNR